MSSSMSSSPWDFDNDDEPRGYYQVGHYYADPSDWYSEHNNPPEQRIMVMDTSMKIIHPLMLG